jgi:hypothetical protein
MEGLLAPLFYTDGRATQSAGQERSARDPGQFRAVLAGISRLAENRPTGFIPAPRQYRIAPLSFSNSVTAEMLPPKFDFQANDNED